MSLIKSFTKPHLGRVINGGPLTIEFSDSVFAQDEAIRKVAQLVRLFILRGGHQIQLNTVNRDRLLDAQKHPENYRNLIVRVWGWSGYFVELDKCYQDHICLLYTSSGFAKGKTAASKSKILKRHPEGELAPPLPSQIPAVRMRNCTEPVLPSAMPA